MLAMKKITCFWAFFFFLSQYCSAQLSGIKTIPGDYPTVAAAVIDLNLQGVGAGGVTFNVSTGYTELITTPLKITATGTASDPIVFQRWGAGADPLIKRTDGGTVATGIDGGAGDAVIRIEGSDYLTFFGIDVTATSQGIEYGFLTHKPSGTDGCHHVTIKNSAITMTKGTSPYVFGIYIGNGTVSASSSTGVTVTAVSGINSDIVITGNTIQNVFKGIVVQGASDAGFYDSDFTVGQAGEGNTIRNFGGSVLNAETYGIYLLYVNNPTVSYNVIDNAGGGGAGQVYGIWAIWFATVTGDVVCNNNSITVTVSFAPLVFALTRYIAVTSAVNSITCRDNIFSAGTMTSRGNAYILYFVENAGNILVSGNAISGTISKTSADGDFYCYFHDLTIPGNEDIHDNDFSNISVGGISRFYGIYASNSSVPGVQHMLNAYNNTISGIQGTSTGDKCGIYISGFTHSNVYNNRINSISGRGAVYGMRISAGQGNRSYIYKNDIHNLNSDSWTEQVIGIYLPTGQLYYVYNNFISDLNATAGQDINAVVGLFLGGGDTLHVYYNTVFLNTASSSATTFGTSGIFRSTSSPSYVELRNNIVVNISAPGPTGGLTVAQRSSGPVNPGAFSLSSDNNDYYAGTGSSHYLYYNQTAGTGYQIVDDYKAAMAPRESACAGENPPFVNVAVLPYDLHMNTTVATATESGAVRIVLPYAVTDDVDDDARWGEAGYTGSGTAPDMGADEFNGTASGCTVPPPGNTLATATSLCQGEPVTLSLQNTIPASGYGFQWTRSPDNMLYTNIPGATGSAYSFSPAVTGWYQCRVSCSLNALTSNAVYIVVNPVVPATNTISASQSTVCQGETVTLTAAVNSQEISPVFQWTVNGLNAGNGLPVYTYIPAGNDLVSCILTSSLPCPSGNPVTSNQVIITVNPVVQVGVTISTPVNPVCAGTVATFYAFPSHGGLAPGYQWQLNGIGAGTAAGVYSCTPSNGDIVTCTLLSSESCTMVNPVTSSPVVMGVNPALPVSITVTASRNPFCIGETVTMTASPLHEGTAPAYQWLVNGLNAGAGSTTFIYSPASHDSIQCKLTSSLGCVSGNPAVSNRIIMTGMAPPVITFPSCFDTITTVSASPYSLRGGIPPGGTYSGAGVNSSTSIFTPSATGAGTSVITYTYSNSALCTATASVTIHILPAATFTCGSNFTDPRDHRVYRTVEIGSQCWMKENLDYGTAISVLVPQTDNCMAEKYTGTTIFYQWDELMRYNTAEGSQGLCPPGWHIPTLAEWDNLLAFCKGAGRAAGPLKDSLTAAGFHSMQRGFLYQENSWAFQSGPYAGSMYWTSAVFDPERSVARGMNEATFSVSRYNALRGNAFPVRCLK